MDPEKYLINLDKVKKPGFPAQPEQLGNKKKINHQFYNSSQRDQEDPEKQSRLNSIP